jgi:carbonic anhydrase
MRIAEPARQRVLARGSTDLQSDIELESIKLSLNNLRTFPWIDERVQSGKLRLSGTMFDIRSGVLTMLQPNGEFAPV